MYYRYIKYNENILVIWIFVTRMIHKPCGGTWTQPGTGLEEEEGADGFPLCLSAYQAAISPQHGRQRTVMFYSISEALVSRPSPVYKELREPLWFSCKRLKFNPAPENRVARPFLPYPTRRFYVVVLNTKFIILHHTNENLSSWTNLNFHGTNNEFYTEIFRLNCV